MIRHWTLVAALALASCGGGGGEAPEPAEDTEKPADETPPPPTEPTLDFANMEAETMALVPSIVETEKALNAAGIEAKLAEKIPKDRSFALDSKEDKDKVAVRTGVILADMLLTIKTGEKDQLVKNLNDINAGLTELGGGADIQTTLNDVRDRLKADAIQRDELLTEADELRGAVIPELEFNGHKRTVPLIQAGGWLEGANLVAKSVPADNPSAADDLLKQPAVVDYFIKYVKAEGSDKAPAGVGEKLLESLNTLKGLAEKTEPLTSEDIATVIKVTDDVLALL